jgi:hypothetical protein
LFADEGFLFLASTAEANKTTLTLRCYFRGSRVKRDPAT